jgi:hypothetical protein
MTFSIFDNGNLVISFDQVGEAELALGRLAAADASAAESLVLFAFDATGEAVAHCVPGERLLIVA